MSLGLVQAISCGPVGPAVVGFWCWAGDADLVADQIDKANMGQSVKITVRPDVRMLSRAAMEIQGSRSVVVLVQQSIPMDTHSTLLLSSVEAKRLCGLLRAAHKLHQHYRIRVQGKPEPKANGLHTVSVTYYKRRISI